MITEDYVSFEIAKLLKEKGFDEYCRASYNLENNELSQFLCHCYGDNRIQAPTLQMAMKWLREIHDLNCQVMLDSWSEAYGSCGYYYMINQKNGGFREISPDDSIFFDSYEDACEAAIKYCLENLI